MKPTPTDHAIDNHPDGSYEHVAVDWRHVPDEMTGMVKEAVLTGKPFAHLLRRWLDHEELAIMSEGLRAGLALIIEHPNPKLAAVQLGFAIGLIYDGDGTTGPTYARRFGLSKQAFFQGVRKFVDQLGTRATRAMRPDTAKQLMSVTNYKRNRKANRP